MNQLPYPKPDNCVVPESKILNRMWSLGAEMTVTGMVTASAAGLPTQLTACPVLKVVRCGKPSTALDSGEGWILTEEQQRPQSPSLPPSGPEKPVGERKVGRKLWEKAWLVG